MSAPLHILSLPANYFKLPFANQESDVKGKGISVLVKFIFLFFFAAFSYYFKVLSEYGYDKLLVFLCFSLPVYYQIKIEYRLPFLTLIFISFLGYAIGYIGAIFYLINAVAIVLILRNAKIMWALALLLIIVLGLALLKTEVLYFPHLIIGAHYAAAAFMFRGIWFYYESKHGLLKSGFWMDLAYFLIPANLCFTFFAIIDPLKFSTSYRGINAFEGGLKRIAYGFGLVLLYRFISNLFQISFEDVNNFSTLIHYAASKYSLVLNIAGIILAGAGTLNLFGFELSSLFGNFLLASSFTELWRKINTNWRDFVVRVFYYPLYFRFKNKSNFFRIYLSINIAYLLTWVLHDYQLFWLSGEYSPELNSFLYWIIFGNLVAFSVYRELSKKQNNHPNLITSALSAAGIFILCSLLWLFWESESISEFTYLVYSAFRSPEFSFLNLILTVVSVFLLYISFFLLEILYEKHSEITELCTQKLFLPFIFALLLTSSTSYFENNFPWLKKQLSLFSEITISEEDNFARDEGYYDNVLNHSKNTDNPWEIQLKGEKKWGTSKGATRRTGNLLMREFIPNSNTDMGYFTLNINSGGFRDDEYNLKKDSNCFRIAIVGSSNECGYGVNKEYVFETIAEKKLDSLYRLKGRKIEILNFASLGSMLIQNIEITKTKVLQYEPDVLIYFSHPKEDKHIARNLSKLIINGVDLKYNILKDAKESSGVSQNDSRQEIVKQVLPYSRGIMDWGYTELSKVCFDNGIKPVWVFIPTPKDDLPRLNYQKFQEMASKHKFVTLDMSEVYNGYDIKKIQASKTDLHPGVLGHQLISELFIKKILENSRKIELEK